MQKRAAKARPNPTKTISGTPPNSFHPTAYRAFSCAGRGQKSGDCVKRRRFRNSCHVFFFFSEKKKFGARNWRERRAELAATRARVARGAPHGRFTSSPPHPHAPCGAEGRAFVVSP